MPRLTHLLHFSSHAGAATAGGVIQLVAVTVMAGLYGASAFGEQALFMAVAHLMALFTSLNLAGYALSLTSLRKRLSFASVLVTGTVIFGILAQSTVTALAVLGLESSLLSGILLLPIYVVAQAFSAIFYGLHLAATRTFRAAGSLLMRPILFLILAGSFWILKNRDLGLIVSLVISELVVAIFLIWGMPPLERKPVVGLSLRRWLASWRRDYRFYTAGALGSYLSNIAANAPILLGGWLMSPVQLGNMALAHRLMHAPIRMIAAPIGAIVNRQVAERFSSGLESRHLVMTAYGSGVLIAGAGYAVMFLVLIQIVPGLPDEWLAMMNYAPAIFFAGAFLFATATIGFLPLLTKNLRFLVLWSSCRIFGVSLSAVATVTQGLEPFYFVLLFAVVEVSASIFFIVSNLLKLRPSSRN